MANTKELAARRRKRVRHKLRLRGGLRARLSVHRSSKNIYAQVIDDVNGRTMASASTLEKDLRESSGTGGKKEAAAEIGKRIAERAKSAGITEVVFDRGGYIYHGRVKALADAAREGGLSF